MTSRRLFSAAALASAALLSLPAMAQAGAYPAKPVRILVPFVPGGPVDVMARVLGEQLTRTMNATVVVENRPGAGGNIGAAAVASAPADGYTLMLATGSILTINEALYPRLGFDPAKDFAPISLLGDMPLVVVVNAKSAAHNVKDLVEEAKQRNAPLMLSSPGNGTTPHLAAELLRRETGAQVVHVPYKGGAESATAILSGQVSGAIETPPSVLPHVQSGRMRALAVAGPARLAALPDVPTTTEIGLPQIKIVAWFGLVAPAGTPAPIVQRLQAEVAQALQRPEVQERFAKLAIRPAASTPQEMAQLMVDDRAKWGRLVKEAGIRLE
ncbi:MAG TPA: tripartite tricarboxylate transporter substrate binding protein [Pseudorhodoferax sp.]|jgi:tripartite-type tricarboxylate transporter receptor subunit TctC|nr:tripartite tricarboxylate transporter substrate binding protein [Pseudorhodoferax sp.]